jgi:radical SAM superfamily enzyme YgiQ (UPF0313 family)
VEKYIKNLIWGSSAKNSSNIPFKVNRNINSITSKGCPYECSFCDRELVGSHQYRTRKASDLSIEMVHLTNLYNVDFIGYIDENATVDMKRLKEWLKCNEENDIHTRWGTSARLDDLSGKGGKANLLKDLNCIYLGFGGESVNKRILTLMNKGKKISNNAADIYIEALFNCRENGIHPNLTWIMGYPTETLEELKETVGFILYMEDSGLIEKKYNNRNLFVATAYPNTVMFNQMKEKINLVFKDFKEYVYALGDATKLLSIEGNILNYSEIPDDQFQEIRGYVDKGELEKVLDI